MSKYDDQQKGYEFERGRQRYIDEQIEKNNRPPWIVMVLDRALVIFFSIIIIFGIILTLFSVILDFLLAIPFWVYLTVFSVIVIRILSVAKISEQLSLKLQKPNQAWLFVSVYIGSLTLLFFITDTYKLFTDSTENLYSLLIIFVTAILGWGILLLIDFISKKVTRNRVQLILKPRFISGYNNMFVNILLGSLKLILFIIMEHNILLTLALYVDSYFLK